MLIGSATTIGKGMNTQILHDFGQIISLLFLYKDGFGIK